MTGRRPKFEDLMHIISEEKKFVLGGRLDLAADLHLEKSQFFQNSDAWASLSSEQLKILKVALLANETVLRNALIGVRRAVGFVESHFSNDGRMTYYNKMGAKCETRAKCEKNFERKI